MDLKLKKKLKKLKFSEKCFKDRSGCWYIKKFKLNGFKARFNWDGKFGTIDIKCYNETFSNKQWESIWITRDFSKFVKRVKCEEKQT